MCVGEKALPINRNECLQLNRRPAELFDGKNERKAGENHGGIVHKKEKRGPKGLQREVMQIDASL